MKIKKVQKRHVNSKGFCLGQKLEVRKKNIPNFKPKNTERIFQKLNFKGI